jgi:hypothetical protein
VQSRRTKRALHGLNADGRVACNPRDREAAHRARMHGIATENPAAVTCKKCLTQIHQARREQPGS